MLLFHGAIYRPNSFVLMLRYCANLKAIRYESTTLNRIVPDKSHRVIVTLHLRHAVVLISNVRIPATVKKKLDGVDLNTNRRDCGVRKNIGKTLRFSADCLAVLQSSIIGDG